jgi:predicted nuclease of predicted toxin-antitoxin system
VSRLFIELYLDEDVDVLVAGLVRARGFHAITMQEAGQIRNNDAEQLAYTVNQQKTLLTHNRADFEALAQQYLTTGQTHYGIIIAVRRLPYEIVRRLLTILNHVTADEMENQLRYI